MANEQVAKLLSRLGEPPAELRLAIEEMFPQEEWENALGVSYLESGWDRWAVNDTALFHGGLGAQLAPMNGVAISAELSCGYFQINVGSIPRSWKWPMLFDPRENVGTAHLLWAARAWSPWYFSGSSLGLL